MKTETRYKSFGSIYRVDKESKIKYWFFGILFLLLAFLFLPWTQNIKSKGTVTSLFQENRPQELNSPIPGKITKWYVREGAEVKKSDTLLLLSEIKSDYLDPNLLLRTKEQLAAKREAVKFYENKIIAYDNQIEALENSRELKVAQLKNKSNQLKNKLEAEKAEYQAALNDLELSKDQYERQKKMYKDGLVSQTDLQKRNVKYQNTLSKKLSIENKIEQTKQEIENNKIEQNSALQEYFEKISKTSSDRFQTLSQVSTSIAELSKLENTLSNYMIRNSMYAILAPQDGQIVQSKKSGIGEIVKEGERIVTIVPTRMDYAVEMYVKPIDLPLLQVGQKVRFVFDGFPSIVFSGWPESSYGTFGGEVVAIENSMTKAGTFRVLVKEDSKDKKWPKELRIGSGAQAITLLNDVPIWYELWRNVNGFPPDFYLGNSTSEKSQGIKETEDKK